MKLYYSRGTCSLGIRIAIHEMGLACEFESVDLASKKLETGGDFLAINPKGAVPVLGLDNGQVLTENTVILQYLADTHAPHLLPLVGDIARYRVLEWLNLIATDVHKACLPLFPFIKVPDDVRKETFQPLLERKLSYINQHLSQHKYLHGEQLCVADFYLYTVLRWLPGLGLPVNNWSSIELYFDRLTERKAFQQALKEEGLIESSDSAACSVK